MPGRSVLAVLVAHASGSWLNETLDSLAGQTRDDLKLIVVAAGDLSVPEARLPAGALEQVIRVPAETAYPRAVKQALESASHDHDYLLLLHDDVALPPDGVATLLDRAEREEDVAAVGPKFVEWDDPQVLQEVGGSIDRLAVRRSGLEAGEVDHGQHDQNDDAILCSSACLLLRRDAYEDASGLDEGLWPLYDDVDLCWRLRASGRRVVVVPTVRVRHVAALSRVLREESGTPLGEIGVRRHRERGRLRFMLKNYSALTLLFILPQYALASLFTLVGAVVRRELWRARPLLEAWGGVGKGIGGVLSSRAGRSRAQVDDRELLRLAARRAVAERRYERLALAGRTVEDLRRLEVKLGSLVRDPAIWGAVGALLVLVVTVRAVLWGAPFLLGELRPFPRFGDALGSYTDRLSAEVLDSAGPSGPGIVILGFLRSLVGGGAAAAQRVALVAPLAVAWVGAVRLGTVLGLREGGRRWFAVASMVNPVTLFAVTEGFFGALVAWSASMWVAASLLGVQVRRPLRRDRLRQYGGWALGWAAVVALHPEGLVWLLALGVALTLARAADGATGRRLGLLIAGTAGAFVLTFPWSLEWFGTRSPLLGRAAGFLPVGGEGLQGATLGAGWPVGLALVVAVAAAIFVGLTATSVALTALLGGALAAGAGGVLPGHTMLAAAGWCGLALLGLVARRIGDELPRYELGWRQAAVIGIVLALGVSWLAGAVSAVGGGVRARTTLVVPAETDDVGRVLWISPTIGGLMYWTTHGFTEEMHSFPVQKGPGERLVGSTLRITREGRTHRSGGLLALADVSHVVALAPEARRGLGGQADLSPQEEQAGGVIYRNDAWLGPAMLLAEAPTAPLTPAGLADVVREVEAVEVAGAPRGRLRVTVPEDATGVLYLARGARGGWSVDGAATQPAATGVWIDAPALEGELLVDPPGGWLAGAYRMQAAALILLLLSWLVAGYLGSPEGTRPRLPPLELRMVASRRGLTYLPLLLLGFGAWLGWMPRAAVGEEVISSAWYCPPIGDGYSQRLAVVNPSETRVRYLLRSSLTAAPVDSGVLTPRGRATLEVGSEDGAVIEAYGERIAVASEVARDGRRSTSLCVAEPASANFFPEGGRGATRAAPRLFEAYVLHNPFPDLARASVRFVAPDETLAPPRLQDVRVPPGEFAVVDPEQFFEPMANLSTEVRVWQGRAIVARRLLTAEELTWSVPTQTMTSGVLPRAVTAEATTTLLAVNPQDRPARVSIFSVGPEGGIPREVLEIPASRRTRFDLGEVAPGMTDLMVQLSSDEPVAVESLVVPEPRRAVSLLPLLEPASRWVIPAADGRTLLLVNPGERPVTVQLERLGPGRALEGQSIVAGGTAAIELEGEEPFGVLVRAMGGRVTAAVAGPPGANPAVPL